MNFENLKIEEIKIGLEKKEFSAQEICQYFLERIKKEDSKIKAFLTLCEDLAMERSREIDKMVKERKPLPPMAGTVVAIKDNILVKGIRCTAGSKILENFYAPYDATVVRRLKDAGAIIIGKTNLDEFAMGSSTENSGFYPTRNPLNYEWVPGGSSGGSAAAVSAGFCNVALGSDTGGSIRQPCAFCGVVGLKPTYGSVSRFGLIAFASSLDQIGPIARNVEDCDTVFGVISGKDFLDSTSISLKKEGRTPINIKSLKIGLPKEYFVSGIDPIVKDEINKAIDKYREMGANIIEISLPHTEYALACYFIISRAEACSNLARYDGLRYAKKKIVQPSHFWDLYFQKREDFGREVKRRILLGTFVLSAGYYEAYYLKAQKVRGKIIEDFQRAFEKVDVIMTPTSPTIPFKLGEKIDDPLKMYLADIFTVSVNLARLPAMSIPVGKYPVGLQIIGPLQGERLIFEVAKSYYASIS